MRSISIEEMQRDPATYIQLVQGGETVVIVQAQQPVAELKPIDRPRTGLRPFGLCAGEFKVPDDFDSPLSDDTLDQFES